MVEMMKVRIKMRVTSLGLYRKVLGLHDMGENHWVTMGVSIDIHDICISSKRMTVK